MSRASGLLLAMPVRGALERYWVKPGAKLEPALRELLYLVLSTPEYQLG